jgi:hypothetical protein
MKGYWHFLRQKEQKWGAQTRQGFNSATDNLVPQREMIKTNNE